ncbi:MULTISPECIES: UDP-glucose 4-epimerase family protein [Pseudomonas]|uniref:SDR family oxidoreductase n=1 Tax=Pseudomonas quercus TaxID=2722792 RepID=A0ABX0YJK9_9PSED|nr:MULTISPECIES: SDR family oxidoreductase [Pseudomonas]MBF7143763.1 SDR family oxidoreductase [Pseudomonas sp. LY10J]NJP02359.1 SDR family oxidoreductase [Pseudomonas quercus]
MNTQLLVTGSTGFVGRRLVEYLAADSAFKVHTLLRAAPHGAPVNAHYSVLEDFSTIDAQHPSLTGVHVVVHLASRVHIMNDTDPDPLAAFRRVNVGHTLQLARSAAAAGVKRFVFVSSVKVNGEGTTPGKVYRETDTPNPVDPYGISKWEAEEGLKAIAAETGLEVVIIRPVLVYGPGVRANFASMMNWLRKGVPLPFGTLHNRRSLVALDNLVSFIRLCSVHPAAASETFLISDGHDVSTTELLYKLGQALHRPARLLPVPAWMLAGTANLLGKKSLSQRLCGSLQVSTDKARLLLGWKPVVTVDHALNETAQYFLSEFVK